MPKIKMKTKRGAAKRFKLSSKGKVKRAHANAGHILTKKSPKRKRRLRKSDVVKGKQTKTIKNMIAK